MDDDTELNTRFSLGDEAAVRTIYQRYGGAMFAVAMSRYVRLQTFSKLNRKSPDGFLKRIVVMISSDCFASCL